MKRNDSNHNIHTSPVNGMPDIEIVDLENETMQDTDSGKSAHKSNKSRLPMSLQRQTSMTIFQKNMKRKIIRKKTRLLLLPASDVF